MVTRPTSWHRTYQLIDGPEASRTGQAWPGWVSDRAPNRSQPHEHPDTGTRDNPLGLKVDDGRDKPSKIPNPRLDPTVSDPKPKPKPRRFRTAVPIVRSTRTLERHMSNMLRATQPKVVKELERTWKRQANALSTEDLAAGVGRGDISPEIIEQWRQDYAEMIVDGGIVDEQWEIAATRGVKALLPGIQSFGDLVDFELIGVDMQKWFAEHGGELIQDLTTTQARAINTVLSKLGSEGISSRRLAQFIRPLIGLTPTHARAVERLRAGLIEGGTTETAALRQSERYAGFLRRRRAQMIARTEIASAYNQGQYFALKDALGEGQALHGDTIIKIWHTQLDERVCPFCGPLHGTAIGFDETFPHDGTRKTSSQVPPGHINCRCLVLYNVIPGGATEETEEPDTPPT